MSYNCTTFKVKEINEFIIPIESLFKHDREDWHPDREDLDNGLTVFHSCETTLIGKVLGGEFLQVIDIDCSGEGSGTTMNWILEPAFKDSTGRFVATCIWEGGDSVNRLIVDKGAVIWEEIDL